MPTCGYCDTADMVYQLEPGRGGSVHRCIECLAIEQGQQKVSLPFGAWMDRDMTEPPDHPDAPDFEPFDPREHDYETVRAWFKVLARLQEDRPIVKRDPDAHGVLFEDTRTFLLNVMGADAHKKPSTLREEE
jgi:hypothetical protein